MIEIKKLNPISDLIYDNLKKDAYRVSDDAADPVGILVRSAAMHEYEINPSLVAVARAGAVVFNTPGANANAVKELVVLALLLSCRDVLGGVAFAGGLKGKEDAAKQVESGKKAFVGPEIFGKTLGVIGLGAIGALVSRNESRRLRSLLHRSESESDRRIHHLYDFFGRYLRKQRFHHDPRSL